MDTKRLGLIPSILLMSLFLLSCGDDSIEEKLIGEWKGTTKNGDTNSMILNKDGSWTLILGDIVIPTPEHGNVVENTTWKVDDTKNPIHLDLIFVMKGTIKIRGIILFILRFLGEDKIQIRTIFDSFDDNTTSPPTMYGGPRPTGFVIETSEQLVLTRQ